jgi:hypothetical protein
MPAAFTGNIGIGGMEFRGEPGGQLEVPQNVAEELIRHHGATPITFTPDIRVVPKAEEVHPASTAAPATVEPVAPTPVTAEPAPAPQVPPASEPSPAASPAPQMTASEVAPAVPPSPPAQPQ